MTLPPKPDITRRLETAIATAKIAAAETLEWFQSSSLIISNKKDQSPVTQADLAAESILREHLLDAFPQDSFIGEESGRTQGTSSFEWVVDPIDGTKSFIRGVPLYATLIGCRHDNIGVLGIIMIPALDEMAYAAAGSGAWYSRKSSQPKQIHVSSERRLDQSLLCSSDFSAFEDRADQQHGLETRQRLEKTCGITRSWGDGYGYLLVATGRAEVMIDPMLNTWDAAAVETVIHEAGGRFTDWQGQARIDSGDGVATNGHVHPEILRCLATVS
ncbi:MAG: inositol monophosphatase family protein [Pirellulales bacterium]